MKHRWKSVLTNVAVGLICFVGLSGCATIEAMSESEKQTAIWVIGFVATAAVISAADGNDTTIITECQRTGNHGCD